MSALPAQTSSMAPEADGSPAASDAPRNAASAAAAPEVLIATIERPTGCTGVHTHTRSLREGLNAAGASCEVVSPFSRGRHWLPVFAVRRALHPLNTSWSTRWYRYWHFTALKNNLMRRMALGPVNAVVAQCPVSAYAALQIREKSRQTFPIAMVCHFNVSEAQEYRDQGELGDEATFQEMLNFERDVMMAVDHVIYVSDWARTAVEQRRGIRPRRSSVIWNGIAATAGAGSLTRQSLGLRDTDVVLITVGSLESRKNPLGLLDLFAELVKREPAARLLIAGEGPQRAAIEQKIRSQGLESSVQLLGLRRDVPALLPLADLYVHYAAMENCPLALIEAARAGLVSAAPAVGGVPELFEAFGAGVRLDPQDPAASAALLQPLLADLVRRRSLGNLARQNFLRFFTRDAMVARYLEMLQLSMFAPSQVALAG